MHLAEAAKVVSKWEFTQTKESRQGGTNERETLEVGPSPTLASSPTSKVGSPLYP